MEELGNNIARSENGSEQSDEGNFENAEKGKRKRRKPAKGRNANSDSGSSSSEGRGEGREEGSEIYPGPNLVEIDTGEVKKKKRRKKDVIVDTENFTSLIVGIFGVSALVGGKHWEITNEEAEMISKPLSSILQRHNLLEKSLEASDGISLLVAVGITVIPRTIISIQMRKDIKNDKEKQSRTVNQQIDKGEQNTAVTSNVLTPILEDMV